jgi:hypothetical protein
VIGTPATTWHNVNATVSWLWLLFNHRARSLVFYFLLIVTAYFLVIALLAIGVVGLHPGALRPMLRAPRHFFRLLVSRRMRQNHALEHATINVIQQRYRRSSIVGMPAVDGFHIRGRVSEDTVISATNEALRRMKRGERQLAFSRRCPTSLVSTQLVLGVVFLAAVLSIWREFIAPAFLIALLGSALLGPPVSPFVQRLLLVDPNPDSLQFRDLEVEQPAGRIGMLSFLVYVPMFVRTAWVSTDSRTPGGDVTLITGEQEEIRAGSYRLRK